MRPLPNEKNFAGEKSDRQLRKLTQRIENCELCPRLRVYCGEVARVKKREFRDEVYWGRPVSGFGDPNAEVWVVGLAPAAHGANRTGRVFTGDSSGRWLWRALHRTGFANQEKGERRDDGLELKGIYISAAARCAPPENKPSQEELETCSRYLDEEFELLPNRRLIIALGSIAFNALLKMLARKGINTGKPRPRFGHNQLFDFEGVKVLTSYHPSRQNTQTGRLTEKMWEGIFRRASRE